MSNIVPENWVPAVNQSQANNADGGPAFPCPPSYEHSSYLAGMTLRDYFAAKALESDFGREDPDYDRSEGNLDYCARLYYRMADAMMKARTLKDV